MRRTILAATLTAAALCITAPARAVLVTSSQLTETSAVEDGPVIDFAWTFSGLPPAAGPGSLTIDYVRLDTNVAGEDFDVFADGVLVGDTASVVGTGCVNGEDATFGPFGSDCTASITLSLASGFFADGSVDILLDASPTVNALIDIQLGAGYAQVTLDYIAAPEPGTLALLGVALAGLGARARRVA